MLHPLETLTFLNPPLNLSKPLAPEVVVPTGSIYKCVLSTSFSQRADTPPFFLPTFPPFTYHFPPKGKRRQGEPFRSGFLKDLYPRVFLPWTVDCLAPFFFVGPNRFSSSFFPIFLTPFWAFPLHVKQLFLNARNTRP